MAAIIQGSCQGFDPENPYADGWEGLDSTVSIQEVDHFAYPVLCYIMRKNFAQSEERVYMYYIHAGDSLVRLEFYRSGNTPTVRKGFDAIVASFQWFDSGKKRVLAASCPFPSFVG